MRKTAVVFAFSITGVLFACVAWAAPAGQVQNASGFVVLESRDVSPRVAAAGAVIEPGTTIRTGDRSNAVLRFRDGQLVALTENSTFRLDGYTYDQAEPEKSRFAGSFLRGSARFVTGAIGDRNREGWRVAMPTATVGIHGTDFVLGMQQVGYVQVLNGEVVLMNNAGSVVFSAGQIGHAPSANALATLVAELPAGVAANFSNAVALSLSATGGSAAGAGLAGGVAGIPIPVWGLIGIGAAAAAAAAGGGSGGSTPTTTQH
ncbi:MAG TPA: FecR family protein [Burkholderiales bacterium]|nr:FecR family protein [Burkholderiales bacterium]